ncbi:MAG: pirin family protein [Myxococcales bacterium]|nr:pirin family protein [Myxococcales bacterium]
MLRIRKSEDRGTGSHGWLHSKHTFSFADYHDPRFMGFRDLRVINEDRVAPGHGFGTHGHRDMEIISYVLEGALEHADSMGNGSLIRPGDVQRMSAGTGVLHSEYNHSKTEPVHFLQIWVLPAAEGLEPSYEQRHFSEDERRNSLRLVASKDARDGSVRVHQDVDLYVSILEDGRHVDLQLAEGRHLWLHVAEGSAKVNDQVLSAGDALATNEPGVLTFTGVGRAHVLAFDLA